MITEAPINEKTAGGRFESIQETDMTTETTVESHEMIAKDTKTEKQFKASPERFAYFESLASATHQKNVDLKEYEEYCQAINENEIGDALLFVKAFQEKYVWDAYEGNNGTWYIYENGVWSVDKEKIRYKDFDKIAKKFEDISCKVDNAASSGEFLKRSKALRTHRRRSAVLETASAYIGLPPNENGPNRWNRLKGELPCRNGVVNLSDGSIRPASPKDFIRTFCPTPYKADAKCPLFEKFIDEVTLGRKELSQFLKRLLGYILLGNPKEEIVVIFYGPEGRNGKGTLVQTIEAVLGEIARTFKSEMLLLQTMTRNASAASPELALLEGCHFAIFSEINKGRKIDASVVKNLSGRDTISARKLFSNHDLAIRPTHTMILQTNFLPRAPADDHALWARNIVIPFEAHFKKDPKPKNLNHKKADKDIKAKLLEEAPGILRFLVEGAIEYLEKGLCIPEIVSTATNQYRSDSDAVAKFLEECCALDPAFSTKKGDMLKAIKEYATDNSMDIPTRNEITAQLRQKFKERSTAQCDFWAGVAIKKKDD